jgi:outer membrane protein assembly factor BamB
MTTHRLRGAVLSGVVALLLLGAPSGHAEWQTYQSNAAHTGYAPGTYDPANFHSLWSTNIGGSNGFNDLAVGGGQVYVSRSYYFNNQPSFWAVDAATGKQTWSKSFGSVYSTNAPAYADGVVYIQTCNHSGDTWLHAFDVNTGKYVFKSPFSAQWESYLSPTIYKGSVYIDGGSYGGMYSFNAKNGDENWFGSVAQYDLWTPAVDDNYCYAYTGQFTVLNRATGATRTVVSDPNSAWNGYSMGTAVVLGTMHDAFATNGGHLLDLDTAGLKINWSKQGGFQGQPCLANGTLYVNRNGGVAALDESTGEQRWVWYLTDASLNSNAMVVTDNLLFACTTNTLYAIDLNTHDTAWTYPVSGRLALSDNVLYVAGSNGTLTALAVPEPATAGLVCIAAHVALLRRSRRRRI